MERRYDLHLDITTGIIAAIERGAGDLHMPWHGAASLRPPVNATTDALYRGVNILSLWIGAQANGYPGARWATFKQWQSVGAMVRKGEKGTPIVFYETIERADDETDEARKIPFARELGLQRRPS